MRGSDWRFTVPILLLSLLAADVAVGAPQNPRSGDDIIAKVERLHIEGAALFRAGRHRAAVEKFREAYQLYPEPNLVYNTARCFEAMGELALAIEHYRRFLRHPEADPAIRRRAERKLSLLLEARRSARPDAAAVTPKGRPVAPDARRGGRASNAAGWVLLSAGLAAAAAGTVTFVLGARDHGQIDDAIDDSNGEIVAMNRARAVELRDSGELKKWIGIGLWGAAGAALVTSAVLFSLDRGEERDSAPQGAGVDVALMPTPGGGALLLGGRF